MSIFKLKLIYWKLRFTKNIINCLQVWTVVMTQVEWNKKEELLADQALKHLKQYSPLFSAFSTTARSELALMLKVQEYCYENMNFMRVFQKIILLFYKSKQLFLKIYINCKFNINFFKFK